MFMVTFLGSLSQIGTTYNDLGSEEIRSHEPKLVYKVRFIREKGKAIAKVLQRSLEAGNSLLR
jgi:hypothetical protein